jgi:maltose/moltooligosaccharide transporter
MQNKPRLSFWQIWNMSFGFLGIQIGFGLQQANMSPIYKYLGADESKLPYLWLAAPVTGLLIQPIIGAMSDRTWNSLGRRRPYFLIGAILSSICLFLMPFSTAVWMAAMLLWLLDFSINTSMEPFRAFVGDKLPEEQRTTGFVMQSFFIGIGQTLANAAPFILASLGVVGALASGIPYATYYSFIIGAAVFLIAVLWTVFTTREYPPEDLEEFRRKQQEGNIVGSIVGEIWEALKDMPTTMKQLAVVQFFTWFSLMCMWVYYGITVARHVFQAPDEKSPLYAQGTEWGGLSFAVYNVVCFLVAFLLPPLAKATSRKTVHFICLALGGLGLLSTYFAHDKYFLWLGMAGVGVAWASILSMPYVILAGAIKPSRMGVYMGVFNLFIVIPQIVMSLIVPQLYENVLGADPLNVVMLGGFVMLLAAVSVLLVKDVGAAAIETSVPTASAVAGAEFDDRD